MNTKTRLVLTGATAALTISLASLNLCAQVTEANRRSIDSDLNRPGAAVTAAEHATMVSKVNKASSLIGMNVRNAQNERLGEIKDLVVDLNSGKIAYAVLSVGGFLGIGDKYVAVPPNAFSVAPDHDQLVLNADKAKIQNAPSFAKNSWPDLHGSTWASDSSYWLSDASARGTGALSETARGTVGSTRSELDRSTATTTPQSDLDRAAKERDTFRGRITAINPEARTMTVQGESGTHDFKFTDRPTIGLKENRNASLTDLKVGFPVSVGFHKEGDSYVAHSVIRTDAPEVK